MISIYTDGSCKGNYKNSGNGGWAFIILETIPGEDMRIMNQNSGYLEGTTNQQMEIVAVTEAIKSLCDVTGIINLYSDSAYVINCLKDRWYDKWRENGWINSKGQPVENKFYWELMLCEIEKYEINFFHIKRNSTKFISLVDGLAKSESRNKPSNNSDCGSKCNKQNRADSHSFSFECI